MAHLLFYPEDECPDNEDVRKKYKIMSAGEDEVVFHQSDHRPVSEYSNIIDILSGTDRSDLKPQCEPEKSQGSPTTWRGKGSCEFCRLPKSSKRSRLVYSRFLCPCDIDITMKGDELESPNTRYGVDNVLRNRVHVRESVSDEDLCDDCLRRLSMLHNLLCLPSALSDTESSTSQFSPTSDYYSCSQRSSDTVTAQPETDLGPEEPVSLPLLDHLSNQNNSSFVYGEDKQNTHHSVSSPQTTSELFPLIIYKVADSNFSTNNIYTNTELNPQNLRKDTGELDCPGFLKNRDSCGTSCSRSTGNLQGVSPHAVTNKSSWHKLNCAAMAHSIPNMNCTHCQSPDAVLPLTQVRLNLKFKRGYRPANVQFLVPAVFEKLECGPGRDIRDNNIENTYSIPRMSENGEVLRCQRNIQLGTLHGCYPTQSTRLIKTEVLKRAAKTTVPKLNSGGKCNLIDAHIIREKSVLKSKTHNRNPSKKVPLPKLFLYQTNARPYCSKNFCRKARRNPRKVYCPIAGQWHGTAFGYPIFSKPIYKTGKRRLSSRENAKPICFIMPSSCRIGKRQDISDYSSILNVSRETVRGPELGFVDLSKGPVLTERNNSNDAVDQNDCASTPRQFQGKVVRVEGDGRCLFRSLVTAQSCRLQNCRRDDFGHPERREDADEETVRADDLRARVVRLMRDNLHFYSQLESGVINADQPIPVNYQKFLDRLEAMSRYNTMPGDLELNAAAMVLERQILVLNTDLKLITAYGQDRYPQSRPLAVRYTKLCADVGHYDALILDTGCTVTDKRFHTVNQDDTMALSCGDFSKLTLREQHEKQNSGNFEGSKDSQRNCTGTRLLAKKEFFFNRDVCKNKFVHDRPCDQEVSTAKEGGAANRTTITTTGNRTGDQSGSGFNHGSTNTPGGHVPPGVAHRRRFCQSCPRNASPNREWAVLEKSTQTSMRDRLDTNPQFVRKRRVQNWTPFHDRYRSPESSKAWNDFSTVGVKRKHQNMNSNSKSGSKKRRTQGEAHKRRQRYCRSASLDKRKVSSQNSKVKGAGLRNIFVGAGTLNSEDHGRCYKRKAENEKRMAKRRCLPWESVPEGVNPPSPRLPDAFSIGQCRCLLCRKKVVSSTHSWLKCYLCGRVAHRECVIKDCTSQGCSADDDDIYFLCRNCVPV